MVHVFDIEVLLSTVQVLRWQVDLSAAISELVDCV